MKTKFLRVSLALSLMLAVVSSTFAKDWVVYEGTSGPALGKRIVFLSGDEEYRSEEGLPMLAKILATRYGFTCTVLFSINSADGTIDPNVQTNTPGLAALDSADLCVMLLRFREWPDADMKHFVDYLNRGKPIIGLRTATHSFAYSRNKQSPYARFDWQSSEWPGGFGRQVLGDTWVNHHGSHGRQSTRGVINDAAKSHLILTGVTDVWGPTDVYEIAHLPTNATVLVWGEVVNGMNPSDPPLAGPKNHPMMPLVWTREYTGENGQTSKIVATTMGAATDLESAGLRRLLVNACFWATGLADAIPGATNVDYVGDYHPTPFGFGKFKRGVKPADLQ